MLKKLDFASLGEIDNGKARKAFEKGMRELYEDCVDRPGIRDARKLTMTVVMKPEADGKGGDLDACDVSFEFKSAIPKRRTKTYNMRAGRSGLEFNELSPEDARQRTLDEADVKAPRIVRGDEDQGGDAKDVKTTKKAVQ